MRRFGAATPAARPVAGSPSGSESSSSPPANVVKQGLLKKQGGSHKSWKDRWFVLTVDSLAYFKQREDSMPIKVVPVSEILDCHRENADTKYGPGRHLCYFSVATEGRVYIIAAKNESERSDWVDGINSLLNSSKIEEADIKKQQELADAQQTEAKPEAYVRILLLVALYH